MRFVDQLLLLALALPGLSCGPSRPFKGPTVDAFNGRLTQNSQPITLPAGKDISLKLFHETGQSFGIPIQPDGTFKIGWMPIGKYSAVLDQPRADGKGKNMYNVPGGLSIQEGQTEYAIELGKDWKP